MKRFMVVVISCIFVAALAGQYGLAQTGNTKGEQKSEQKQQGMKMDEGNMKQMMEKCQPMMKQMMGGCMMKDMMQMMTAMMDMQEKMLKGPSGAEKKQMMQDMAQMKEKMQQMMSMQRDMAGMCDSQARRACAEQWLKKAIDLHALHMANPATATAASQMELMDQIKKAYDCITGAGPGMCGQQPKAAGGSEPKNTGPTGSDMHKH
jgi:hypothetical protein